jgi:hypothetical protein
MTVAQLKELRDELSKSPGLYCQDLKVETVIGMIDDSLRTMELLKIAADLLLHLTKRQP